MEQLANRSQDLRILIVEDQAADAELLQRELRRGGFRFDARCVATADAFKAALHAYAPDLILSDFSMPGFDGLSALALSREHLPDVPFIFVSGTIGEDRAVEALRHGASDYILKDRPKRLLSAISRALDTSEKQKALRASQHALADSEKRFRTFMQHMPASAAIVDSQGAYVFVNVDWERSTGRQAADVVGRGAEEILPPDLKDEEAMLRQQVITDKECISRITRSRSNGQEHWWLANHFPIPDDDGVVRQVGSVAIDITEQKNQEEKLNYLASHDILTGLPNRSFFYKHLSHQLIDAELRASGTALILWNIDRFSTICDSLGHGASESLLLELAKRLQSHWPDGTNIAHIAADCFAAVLPDASDQMEISQLVKDVRRKVLALPFEVDGHDLAISMTAGVSLAPVDGNEVEILFRHAQRALNHAKRSHATLLFYEPAMDAAADASLMLENRLRRAVEKQQFVLHYQPKVSLATGAIVGLEALIRWQDPVSGLVPPAKFIPVLEETGLIREAGEWALRQALGAHRTWTAAGLNAPRIAVNVSAMQLAQKQFTQRVLRIIDGLAPNAHGLDLEITESLLMTDVEGSIAKLRAIQEAGCNIAIDDFGTGYSSLSYLTRLPINALKIDRSFVSVLGDRTNALAIASTIVSLAQSLNLKVIAEGVENEEQREVLKLLRCDEGQGYLFYKPLPFEEITALLKTGA